MLRIPSEGSINNYFIVFQFVFFPFLKAEPSLCWRNFYPWKVWFFIIQESSRLLVSVFTLKNGLLSSQCSLHYSHDLLSDEHSVALVPSTTERKG